MRFTATASIIGAALALSSCTNVSGTPTPVQTLRTTQPQSTSMFPPVTFDPCAEIDDAMVREFGFDPTTRIADARTTEIELRNCSFTSYERILSFMSQNRPWEELPSALTGTNESTTVNGREAIYAINPAGKDSCAVLMRADYGAVIVDIFMRGRLDLTLTACDGIMQIAETIEPLIENA